MAVFKCKMCGGDLPAFENMSIVECEYCGSAQTTPKADDERKINLFNRANRLRLASEFDKAAGVYESIVAEFCEEAEAYWGLCLCKYGIEYVDDKKTGKKIPTCHRTSMEGIFESENFKLALEYADFEATRVYREEAKEIDRLQKTIIEIAQKEEPFDIFICYKETDEKGERTKDSVIAQEIYSKLTDIGYKVFFSRITLEGKLGVAYEPYIYAALNSATLMLVVGTSYENFNAAWVKNEWSRFLNMMEKDKEKHLIPCYEGVDAYDMPAEFSSLQAQDLAKIGAYQDLLHGIEKLVKKDNEKPKAIVRETGVEKAGIGSLLKRAFMFLEDGNFKSADEYCEKVLDIEPQNAEAYLGKLMAEVKVKTKRELVEARKPFDESDNYKKVIRFGDKELKNELEAINKAFYTKAEEEKRRKKAELTSNIEKIWRKLKVIIPIMAIVVVVAIISSMVISYEWKYNKAKKLLEEGKYDLAVSVFYSIGAYDEADKANEAWSEAEAKAEEERKEAERNALYKKAQQYYVDNDISNAYACYTQIPDYKDSAEKLKEIRGLFQCNSLDVAWIGHAVGLKEDGTVVVAGDNEDGECNVSGWENIVAVEAGNDFTIGLKKDGTVVAAGDVKFETEWTDIVQISANAYHAVGLKSDGTVVATVYSMENGCDVGDWSDIVAVSAGVNCTAGLKKDGTVVATGENKYGECNVDGWTDIVAISACEKTVLGLKNDGTVVTSGRYYGDDSVSDWHNIVAISAGDDHILGLTADGRVVAHGGFDLWGELDVTDFSGIVGISAGYDRSLALYKGGWVKYKGSPNAESAASVALRDIKVSEYWKNK